jgi:hypothetical protein
LKQRASLCKKLASVALKIVKSNVHRACKLTPKSHAEGLDVAHVHVGRPLVLIVSNLAHSHRLPAQWLTGLLMRRSAASSSVFGLQGNERKRKFQMI